MDTGTTPIGCGGFGLRLTREKEMALVVPCHGTSCTFGEQRSNYYLILNFF